MKKYHLALLIVAGLAAGRANADALSITLDSAILTGSPGDVLKFFGNITNNTASSVDLAADNFNLTDFPPTAIDDSPFFANTPPTLNANGTAGDSTGDVELFDITIPNPFTLPAGEGRGDRAEAVRYGT